MMSDETQCSAGIVLHDDRWGALHSRCELPAGHDKGWGATEHSIMYTATDPVAYLRWTS